MFWKPCSQHAKEPKLTCRDPLGGGLSPVSRLQDIRGSEKDHTRPPSPARPTQITRNRSQCWGGLSCTQGNLDSEAGQTLRPPQG